MSLNILLIENTGLFKIWNKILMISGSHTAGIFKEDFSA